MIEEVLASWTINVFFVGRPWAGEVTPARVQGCVENVKRLRNSPVMNQLLDHPEWMSVLFNEQGREEPFPRPDQALPPVKPRGRARD